MPGKRLVLEELARKLNVSRSPINNALILLMKDGYVEFVPNKGYSVSVVTQKEAEELWQARELIELSTIPIMIRNLNDKKLERLRQLKEEYEKYTIERTYQADKIGWNLDKNFHTYIIEMADNATLTNVFRDICERSYLRQKTPVSNLGGSRGYEVILEHQKIYEAIKLRDIEGCRDLIKSHLKAGKKFIFETVFSFSDSIG